MLRYSYKVQLRRYEELAMRLQMDLIKNPDNQRAKEKIKETESSIEWFKKQIADGKDPGVHII